MNRKGFTLIELIATIVLLGIISSISFVSITKVLKQNKIDNCHTLINNIKSAAKEYVSDNRYKNPFSTKRVETTAKYLVDNNYLSQPIYDPYEKNEMTSSELTAIKVIIDLYDNYTVKTVTVQNEGGLTLGSEECPSK